MSDNHVIRCGAKQMEIFLYGLAVIIIFQNFYIFTWYYCSVCAGGERSNCGLYTWDLRIEIDRPRFQCPRSSCCLDMHALN